MARIWTALLGGMALAACTADSPAWELAGEPGLLLEVKHFYERRALEEAGQCPRPILEGVTSARVLEEDADRMQVQVSYYYRDFIMDDEDCEEGRPLRCGVLRQCRGFGTRLFEVARTAGGAEVVEMSGPQR